MRPTIGEVETRALPDAAPEVDGRKLRGLIPYGVESRDLGGFVEVIEPGALDGADLSDLIATREHDRSNLLGRYPTTLEVESRDDGFAWAVELPSSPVGEDVRVAVERGDLRSTSWRMIVKRDEWRGNVRHVHEIGQLADVCVTAAPAYGEARAELRSEPDPEPAAPAPDPPEEASVPEDTPGGLQPEDRAQGDAPSVESRIIDAIHAVPKGESRSLTNAADSGGPISPVEVSTFVWDRLRDAAVILAAGCPVITTSHKTIKWPRIVGDVTADFYDELEEIDPSDPDFDEFEVDPKAIKALVRASSEVVEDSDPDLLELLRGHLNTILALKLDRELLIGNAAKGFKGLTTALGTNVLDADGSMENYDLLLRAAGVLLGKQVNAPLAAIAHPYVATALSLLKDEDGSNRPLTRPEGAPPMYLTTQVGRNAVAGTSTALVFAPSLCPIVRRRDVTVEVDRSQEFSSDAVLIRGKVRATLFLPYAEAVVKIINVPAPDPAVIA